MMHTIDTMFVFPLLGCIALSCCFLIQQKNLMEFIYLVILLSYSKHA